MITILKVLFKKEKEKKEEVDLQQGDLLAFKDYDWSLFQVCTLV